MRAQWVLAGVLAVRMVSPVTGSEAGHGIWREGDEIRIRAGVLERTLRVSGGRVELLDLQVAGRSLIEDGARGTSFQVSRAVPNRDPLELLAGEGDARRGLMM